MNGDGVPSETPALTTGDVPADMPEDLRAEFFEAVRAIVAASGLPTGEPAIGGNTRPQDEPVRFVAAQGSRHPDAELDGVTRDASGQVRLSTTFMGLTGPLGVMPDHYSDLVVARERARDEAFGRFLDLFNHRAISLFYRAWAKYRLPVAFAEAGGSLADPFSTALGSLAGLTKLAPGGDPRILAVAGLLARRVRSPEALRRTLTALYGLPVAILELQPRRIPIPPDDCTRVGERSDGGKSGAGAFTRLAVDAVLGVTATDVAGRFRIRIGPVDRACFDAFFDPGGLRDRIVTTVRQVTGATSDFDIQLVLAKTSVPRSRLDDGATRLGQTSWLLHRPAESDRSDAILPGRSVGA